MEIEPTNTGWALDGFCVIPRQSLDTLPDAFIEVDEEQRIVAWNASAESIFGWSRQEAIGRHFCTFLISAIHQTACGNLLRELCGEQCSPSQSTEIQGIRKDRREVQIELLLFQTSGDGAKNAGILARDISRQKEIERAAEERLHALIDQLGEEYFETDLRGNYQFVNTSLGDYYHVKSGAELKGRNFQSFFSSEDIKTLKDGFHEVYLTGERKRQEFTVVLNGRRIYVEHTVTLKRDRQGRPIGFMVLSRDCTERKLAQMELAKAIEAAQAAALAKSEFLANMSHEIRTPLNGIIGTLELTHGTELSSEQRELLDMASASADSLLAVINDILDFSKIEAGKLQFEHIAFEIREVVAEALRSLAIRAHQKGLELAYDVAPEIPAWVAGDPARLKQILLNLAGNAIKFTDRGEVVVRVERLDAPPAANRAALRFSVSDTGIGIPKDKQHLIFDAFSQADNSTTRRYGGTGLGLAISSRLVRLMGGEIEVESEPGCGSVFRFTVRLEAAAGPGSSDAASGQAQVRGVRVLIVDDNATNRRILQMLLTSWGMLPVTADSATAALAAMRNAASDGSPIGLVLTDCHMPEGDGFDLVDQIRKNMPMAAPTIMMLTSEDYHTLAPRCREMGVAKYLIKPLKQSELLAALCESLRVRAIEGTPATATPEPSHDTASLDILLAEDNAVNQALAARMLEKLGHRVVIAGTGREALAKLNGRPFDVVLMDVQMPEMDGFAATAAIRKQERGSHLPIIALTAHAMSGDRQLCLDAGMDAYISKPIDFRELRQILADVLHRT